MMLSRLACILIGVYAPQVAAAQPAAARHGRRRPLVRPFDFGELPARLRALRRRPPVSQAPWIVIGELEFDSAAREALVSGDRPSLTVTELGILEILVRPFPGVADRRSIAQHLWDNEADVFGSNTIDVHLARLRSKLADAGGRIETVRGVGYRIVAS
jgi:DNA-binding response OmpR family regulator